MGVGGWVGIFVLFFSRDMVGVGSGGDGLFVCLLMVWLVCWFGPMKVGWWLVGARVGRLNFGVVIAWLSDWLTGGFR